METDDCVLEGLYHEWIGDAHLITGTETATGYYENPLEYYDNVTEDELLSWAMEEEFDYIMWAVEDFISIKYDEEAELPVFAFEERVKLKIEYMK